MMRLRILAPRILASMGLIAAVAAGLVASSATPSGAKRVSTSATASAVSPLTVSETSRHFEIVGTGGAAG